ncbi:MAG: acyltransferase family protein [Nevskiaceae bacterium]|nr:MAG: acyltransferase family protein [Nevskiaceae bacterium]TBR72620.1 MAG: acyltransferase family protein [Nevskiaceae bacterium]
MSLLHFPVFDLRQHLLDRLVTPDLEALVDRMPKPVGSFGYDPWGYNNATLKISLGLVRLLYLHYFRVETHGLENIPDTGRVLVIPNHSGQLPMDGVLVGAAMALNTNGPRLARAMIERFFPTVPWLGNYLNAIGAVIGDPLNCERMLDAEEAVIVFPEGVRGSGKLFRHRYQLQRFGNGFMHLAMKHGTPIIPTAVIGCEETMPSLYDIKPLARLLGIPYAPVAPPLPLPARVTLWFGKPMHFKPVTGEAAVQKQVEVVKARMREMIEHGLAQRTRKF